MIFDRRNGGMVEWQNGGSAEWRNAERWNGGNGGMAEWWNGGMAEWWNGEMEGWPESLPTYLIYGTRRWNGRMADRQVGEGNAKGRMGDDQIEQPRVSGGDFDHRKEDQQRNGGYNLGHHQGLVDHGKNHGLAFELWRTRCGKGRHHGN